MENTVGNIATWVIASSRDRSFATLPELRAAVHERVDAYNAEPFQKRAGSRRSVFEAMAMTTGWHLTAASPAR